MRGDPLSAADIVEVLSHAGRQMESSPGFLESQNEEGLRFILLTVLNGATNGKAFAEAFNGRGKTDLLVRSDGLNVYLAECKIYSGPKGLEEAIDQLLGYTGWRERHVGLIVFVRSAAMTTAIAAAHKALDNIDSVSAVEVVDDHGSELVAAATHPADSEVDLQITLQLFNLPIPRDREELIGGEVAGRQKGLDELLAAQGPRSEEEGLAYQTHSGPSDVEMPIRADALVRVERITPEGRVAVDAVPLDERAAREHAPAGAIEFSDHDAAQQALRRALRDNVAVEIPGARMRFDRMPPLFREAADRVSEADPKDVTVRLVPRGLWQCRMRVDTDRGKLEVPMAFAQVDADRKDEICLRGSFHDLSLILRVQRGGEPELSWEHEADDTPLRERLASLDFLYALSGKGEIHWESIDPPEVGSLSVTAEGSELDETLVFDRQFFENLVLIEDYLKIGFELPEEIDEQDVAAIFAAAKAIRTREAVILLDTVTVKAKPGTLAVGDETELHGPVPVDMKILGIDFRLGLATGEFPARVTEVEPHEDSDHVTLIPRDQDAARVRVSDLRPTQTESEKGENQPSG